MSRKLLLILLAIILVTGWGCGRQTIGTGTQANPSTREENTGSTGTATPGNRSGEDNLVIRSDNKVSDEEAKAMLEEVDRQLDEMVRMLEELEEVNQNELEYGGDQP